MLPQIQNILDFRNTATANRTNESMHELTEQGIRDNKLMQRLAYQSARDTRSMMIIALMSAIFLPASFVAVCTIVFIQYLRCQAKQSIVICQSLFGSNFFGFDSSNGKHTLLVASNIWIYFLTTILLLSLTVTGWWYWRKSSIPEKAGDEGEPDIDIEKQLDSL